MSRQPETLDKATAVDRNLALAGAHLAAVMADPTLLEQIPEGATLVLIPDDDPPLAQHNLGLALQAFATGKNVYLYHVRTTSQPERAEAETAADD